MSIKPPDKVLIPRGHFIMGSITGLGGAFEEEAPMHVVYLTDYYLSRTPITHREYAQFIAAMRYPAPDGWRGMSPPFGKEKHPVSNISWQDATAYCDWLSSVTGLTCRLPSEAEWEKGARGIYAQLFPWGNTWEPERCNTSDIGVNSTTAVDYFQTGKSPYGLLDMAGNVFEWTNTLWRMSDDPKDAFHYPYDPDDGREAPGKDGRALHIVRGGSYVRSQLYARCSSRLHFSSITRTPEIGFRIAIDANA
jgi:formylglycine-generating enzyme required for sulfatase activity